MNPGRGDNAGAVRPGRVRMLVRDPGRIVVLMALTRVSTRQLAQDAGWRSHTYLLRVLSGEVRSVQAEPAMRIAEVLGVSVDDLFLPWVTTNAGRNGKRAS